MAEEEAEEEGGEAAGEEEKKGLPIKLILIVNISWFTTMNNLYFFMRFF